LSLEEGDTENLGAVELELSKEEVKQVDEVSALPPSSHVRSWKDIAPRHS